MSSRTPTRSAGAKKRKSASSVAGRTPRRKPAAGHGRAPPFGDWRAETLDAMRRLIVETDPGIVEERKWKKPSNPAGVPAWSHGGIVCTGETYKAVVKLTFARGASLPDPKKLFNASLEGGTRRAIDIREGERVDAGAFRELVRAAVAANAGGGAPGAAAKSARRAAKA